MAICERGMCMADCTARELQRALDTFTVLRVFPKPGYWRRNNSGSTPGGFPLRFYLLITSLPTSSQLLEKFIQVKLVIFL